MDDEEIPQPTLLRDAPMLDEAPRVHAGSGMWKPFDPPMLVAPHAYAGSGSEATEEERRLLEEWDTACKEEMAAVEVVSAAKMALEEARRRRVEVRRRLDVIWAGAGHDPE